jgi:hypothetical protein
VISFRTVCSWGESGDEPAPYLLAEKNVHFCAIVEYLQANMNEELERLAREISLDDESHEALRLAFGLACVERVRHLLEDAQALECLDVLVAHVCGRASREELAHARERIERVANSHRGSNSIDGTSHAAVSATYAVANALAGKALQAASYAAYATVYAYGGYAVREPSAFRPEFDWQVAKLHELKKIRAPVEAGGSAPSLS